MKKGGDNNFTLIISFSPFFRFLRIHFETGNRVEPGEISFLVLSILQERNLLVLRRMSFYSGHEDHDRANINRMVEQKYT